MQTKAAAHAEDRRRLGALALTGSPWGETVPRPELVKAEASRAPQLAEVAKSFLTAYAPTCLKPSTIRGYKNVIERVLGPRIGSTPLDAIDATLARKLDAELVAEGAKPSTRRNVLIVLRSILGHAVEAKLLASRPELPALPRVGRTVLETMSASDLEKVLAVANARHRLAFMLAAYAGLRAGEVRGLRWSDVDLSRKRLVVRQSICHGVATTPKSGNERIVPLAAPLLSALLEIKKREGLVARNADGTPWKEFGLRLAFRRACERAKVKAWRFHDLRHHFVTSLFRAGVPANVAQALAGHRELTTTQRYAHAVEADLFDAVARLDRRAG